MNSDIPESSFMNAGLSYNFKNYLSTETYTRMISASPISLTNNIKCPILLAISK